VRIDGCDRTAATGRLDPPPGRDLPVGVRAFRIEAVAPRLPVQVPPALAADVGRSSFVRAAAPGERHALRVRAEGDGLFTVIDAIGPLHAPRPAVVPDLERIAKATALRTIADQPGWELNAHVTVEWGRVLDGRPVPLPLAGARLRVGEPIYVCVRNIGADPVYVSLIDIGVSARICVLNPAEPAGRRLGAGDRYVFGFDDRYGRLAGAQLGWPAGLDPAWPRPETILVLVTSRPLDVGVLEQDAVSRSARSPLEEQLFRLTQGTTREVPQQVAAPDRYLARTIDFDLAPS
jgi:hypothetical protein